MPTVDYLPFGTSVGANVDSQGNYAGSSYQTLGFQNGIALPNQANKAWRQSSMIAAALANFIANQLNTNILDDGNLTNLITNLTAAIKNPTPPTVVTFSPTMVFAANNLSTTFEVTLTANATGPTLTGVTPGQILRFIIHQDATGGRTFVNPGNLPLDQISTTASKTSFQDFIVDNTSTLRPMGPMTVS